MYSILENRLSRKEHLRTREYRRNKIVDYFNKNPEANLTARQVKEVVFNNNSTVKEQILTNLLNDLTTKKPALLSVCRCPRKINGLVRSVLVFSRNKEASFYTEIYFQKSKIPTIYLKHQTKLKICDYFKSNPDACLTARQVTNALFDEDTRINRVRSLLLDLCDRAPHFLKSEKKRKILNGGKEGREVYHFSLNKPAANNDQKQD